MKTLLLASTALLASPALASNSWTVGQQTISFPPAGTAGTILAPNTAPAYAYQLTDIASNFTTSQWVHTDTQANLDSLGYEFSNTSTLEPKSRFDCQETIAAQDDPMLAFNVANGSSHLHHFMGNYLSFTQGYAYNLGYNQLRASGNSTCYGGPLNRSLYWEPTVFKVLTNGVTGTKRTQSFITYYIGGFQISYLGQGGMGDPAKKSLWPRGLGMIGGFDMADPGNSRAQSMVTTAGANYSAQGNGFAGWYCSTPTSGTGSVATSPIAGATHQPWLRNGDGTPTLDCNASDVIIADVQTESCWDGVNLDSPDERSHVAYPITDSLGTTYTRDKCPQNWASIPQLEVKAEFTHTGQSDYTNWWLSSDRMGMNFGTVTGSASGTTITTTAASAAMLSAKWHAITGAGIPANTMITNVSGTIPNLTLTLSQSVGTIGSEAMTIPFNNGETFHFDFRPAWDEGTAASPGIFLKHMVHCEGLTITQASTGGTTATLTGDPHECGFGRISATEAVFHNEASPDGSAPNPIVNLTPNLTGKNGYFPTAHGTAIPGTVHHSH